MTRDETRRWFALVSAFFTLAIAFSFSLFSLPVFYPALIKRFAWSHAQAAAGGSIVLLLIGMLGPGIGWLADRITPRTVLLWGIAGGSLAMTALSFITTLTEYYAGCVLLGLAASAVSLVPASMLVAPWFPGRRGLIVGIISAGTGLGGFVTPVLVTTLIGARGAPDAWRWVAIVPALLFVMAFFLTPTAPASTSTRAADFHSGHAAVALRLGPALFFAAHTLTGIQQHLTLYLTGQGVSAARAAFALSLILGGSVMGRLGGGVIADRLSARASLVASIACLIAGIAGLLAIAPTSPFIAAVAAVFGLGYGGVFNAPPIIAFEYVGAERVGALMGTLMLFFGLGTSSGGLVAGWVFDRVHRYATVFWIDLASCGVALLILTALRRPTTVPGASAVRAAM